MSHRSQPKQSGEEYGVGYGKPPKASRFKKGTSGNPNGRPKRILSNIDHFEKVFSALVTVRINGKERRMTGAEAAFWQMRNMAVSGDLKAVRAYLDCCGLYGIGMRPSELHPGLQQLLDAFHAGPVPRGRLNPGFEDMDEEDTYTQAEGKDHEKEK